MLRGHNAVHKILSLAEMWLQNRERNVIIAKEKFDILPKPRAVVLNLYEVCLIDIQFKKLSHSLQQFPYKLYWMTPFKVSSIKVSPV